MADFVINYQADMAFLTIPSFNASGLVAHGFTTRLGGFSQFPYHSLNMALHVEDDPQAVVANRRKICNVLKINHRDLVAAQQVHGEKIRVATALAKGKGAVDYNEAFAATDALITRVKMLPLSTYYADCVPIFLLDPVTPAIGLVHAGWKGTVLKIGAKTVQRMHAEFGTDPAACLVGIGPAIGSCCYEVELNVVEKLAQSFKQHEKLLTPVANGKWKLDLAQANVQSLLEVGVSQENITCSGLCTCCRTDLFYSFRAEQGQTGRMAALLMLK